MLSRTIHRTPGEGQRPTPRTRTEERAIGAGLHKPRFWAKLLVLAAPVVLLAAVVLLNANAEIEPRVRLLVLNYERPGLLPVLLITSVLSIACTVAVRAFFQARREFDDNRGRSLTALVELEASRIKHASVPKTVAAS